MKDSFKKSLEFLALLLILVGNAIFLRFNAFRYFDFYDMSFGMDGGWRILNGQKPYVDFIYFSGPVHLYMHAFFFKLFGFGKTAIWAHLVTVHSIVIVLVFLMARRRMPDYFVWLMTVLTTTSFYWPVSHPWHDQSAHLWGILGVAFLVWQIPFKNKKYAFISAAFCSFMAVVSFMTKINIGAVYWFVFAVVCCLDLERKEALKGFFVGTWLGIFLMSLTIVSPEDFFEQVFSYSHLTAHDRLSGLLNVSQWFVNFYWLPLAIILVCSCPTRREHKVWIVLFIGIFLVAIVSIVSGQMVQSANIFLWGIFMTAGLILFFKVQGAEPNKFFSFYKILLLEITLGLIFWSTKYGLDLQTWSYVTGAPPVGNYAIHARALKGWKCDPMEGEILDEMANYIQTNIPRDESLLIFSELQLLYALTGRDSYRGIPIFVFRQNHMPVPGAQLEKVKQYIQKHLPQWIIADLNSYFAEMPYVGLSPDVMLGYDIPISLGPYVVFRKIP